ncbi:MAG: hypothetical protein WA323_13305, partial [Candidatus Nitrosopolaris sp.]
KAVRCVALHIIFRQTEPSNAHCTVIKPLIRAHLGSCPYDGVSSDGIALYLRGCLPLPPDLPIFLASDSLISYRTLA